MRRERPSRMSGKARMPRKRAVSEVFEERQADIALHQGRAALDLYEDRNRNLWAGTARDLVRWRPGPAKSYPTPDDPDGIQGFAEDSSGTLLIASRKGLKQLKDGQFEAYALLSGAGEFRPSKILRDREGGLWIGTVNRGVVHVHEGRWDVLENPMVSRVIESPVSLRIAKATFGCPL